MTRNSAYIAPAQLVYSAKLQKRIQAAMEAVANGREVRIVISDYGYVASLAMRKSDGWWTTAMIPFRYNPVDPTQPDQQMLAFMGFLPKEFQITREEDAIAFAQLWTEEHCED